MFKKQMKALTPKGSVTAHKGKGSEMAGMPNRRQVSGLGTAPNSDIGDYAKATPMAQPSPVMPMLPPGGFPPM